MANTSKLFLCCSRSILSKWQAERHHFLSKELSVQIPIQNLRIHFQVRLLHGVVVVYIYRNNAEGLEPR
jgi:hypothetical protein